MKPYYQDDWVTIYHGDCREVLPTLPKVDLVLTDPPYGLGKKINDGGGWSTNPIYDAVLEWDKCTIPIELIFNIINSGFKTIIWGGNYYCLPASRCWLIWKKLNSVPTMADCELAWTNLDKNTRFFEEIINADGKRVHPTQKPESLMKWCLNFIAMMPKLTLDPFMGSGTTLRAAKDLNLKSIGIDIEEKYCEIAAKRMSQEVFNLL